MTTPSLDTMRRACWLHWLDYNLTPGGGEGTDSALAILRAVSEKLPVTPVIAINPNGYVVTVDDSSHFAPSLDEAALKCAYAAIPEADRYAPSVVSELAGIQCAKNKYERLIEGRT
jgi:hypothetical protein